MRITQRDIDQALEDGSFCPHFQPLVSLQTGKLHGVELLARWRHCDYGWISPEIFIPLAEKNGWIDRLTETLFHSAFRVMVSLEPAVNLSVNISPVQLRGLGLPSSIQSMASDTGFSLQRLIVEVTESALAGDMIQAREVASVLKEMGCRLALDDFGTGYSSLTQLQSLPFDELKVDRSFISSMAERRDSRKIVAAVVGLGQSLGLRTVAEGVETSEQAQMLQWLGCDLAQGWYYGKASSADDLPAALSTLQAARPSAGSIDIAGRVARGSLDVLPSLRLAQLQAIYDGAPVGLAFLDRDLRYKMLNRRLATMNGHPMEDHIGRPVSEMIPDIFPTVEGYIRRALDGEAIEGVEITKPSSVSGEGKTLLLSYQPARDEAKEVIGVSVAIVDISPMKRAEKAARETEEHFRQMIELLPQIPWIIDPEGRALDVSQRWMQITGMKDGEWQGFGWLDALHPDDLQPTLQKMRASFKTKEPINLIYRVRKSKDEPWRPMRSRGAARIREDGEVVCWYGCLEDVS